MSSNLHIDTYRASESPEYIMTPLTYIDSAASSSPPSPTSLVEYSKLKEEYMDSGVSYLRQNILKRLVKKGESAKEFEFGKCYHYHNWVSDIYMFTELEMAHWGLLISRMGEADRALSRRCFLLLTGYLAKQALCEDMKPIEAYVYLTFPQFKRDFDTWSMLTECGTTFDAKHVNSQLNNIALSQKRRRNNKNYEQLVSSVLARAKRDRAPAEDPEQEICETRLDELLGDDPICDLRLERII